MDTTIAASTASRQTDLQTGETVDIHITGAVVAFTIDGKTSFRVGEPGAVEDHRDFVSLHVDWPCVRIERGTPVDGEPQRGDLWRDAAGALYFAGTRGDDDLVFYGAEVRDSRLCWRWPDVHTGPNGPITLEYRPEPRPVSAEDGGTS